MSRDVDVLKGMRAAVARGLWPRQPAEGPSAADCHIALDSAIRALEEHAREVLSWRARAEGAEVARDDAETARDLEADDRRCAETEIGELKARVAVLESVAEECRRHHLDPREDSP